jgi:hypothetical protein
VDEGCGGGVEMRNAQVPHLVLVSDGRLSQGGGALRRRPGDESLGADQPHRNVSAAKKQDYTIVPQEIKLESRMAIPNPTGRIGIPYGRTDVSRDASTTLGLGTVSVGFSD